MPAIGSLILNRDDAAKLQDNAQRAGDLLIWTVTQNPSDFPDKCVARPHSTTAKQPLACALFADTLDELRAIIPQGLTQLRRTAGDDAAIVEVWL